MRPHSALLSLSVKGLLWGANSEQVRVMFGFPLNSNHSEHGASEMAQQIKGLAAKFESDSCKLTSDLHT